MKSLNSYLGNDMVDNNKKNLSLCHLSLALLIYFLLLKI